MAASDAAASLHACGPVSVAHCALSTVLADAAPTRGASLTAASGSRSVPTWRAATPRACCRLWHALVSSRMLRSGVSDWRHGDGGGGGGGDGGGDGRNDGCGGGGGSAGPAAASR